MSSSTANVAGSVFLDALKYGNIILTGLILAYPKQFLGLLSSKSSKFFRKSGTSATSNNQQTQIEEGSQKMTHASTSVQEILTDDQIVELKFNVACALVRKEKDISVNDQLELYGLYKQATVGSCKDEQKPSALHFEAAKKYEHWLRFSDLNRIDAMRLYVEYFLNIRPKYLPKFSSDQISKQLINKINEQKKNEDGNNLSEKELFKSSSSSENEEKEQETHKMMAKPAQLQSQVQQKFSLQQPIKKEFKLPTQGFGLSVSRMQSEIGSEFLSIRNPSDCVTTAQTDAFFSLIDDGNIDGIQSSINNGFDLLTKNSQGTTALHYALETEQFEVFHSILEQFPQIDAQDADGFTPLYIAVLNENQQLSLLLLQKGANPHEKDRDGQSPYDIASSSMRAAIDSHILNNPSK